MGNLQDRGAAWQTRVNRQAVSSVITYRRGGLAAVLPATQGQSDFGSTEARGVRIEDQTADFIVATADLVAAGFDRPQPDDKIDKVIAGRVQTYNVSRPDGSGQPWHYSDPASQTRIRIHTRLDNETTV